MKPSYILGLACVVGTVVIGGVILSGKANIGLGQTASPNAAEAKIFLAALYDHYASGTGGFSPLNEQAANWFDPAMVALMREDVKLAQGEVGAIDSDPVCACQDHGRILADIKILTTSSTTARAGVVLIDRDLTPPSETALAYDLVKIKGGWRIHDITGSDGSSLRQRLIKSNAELKKTSLP